MPTPTEIYNEFILANLPAGITYDEDRARFVTFNGKYFPTYLQAKWYLDYLKKFGFEATVEDEGIKVKDEGEQVTYFPGD